MRLKNILKQHLRNIPGWRTKRRIVVLESDDWGTIRTPSREILERLRNEGIEVDKCHYMRYDSLESEEDLELLFDILKGFKDIEGNHPVFTANSLIANPDFEKIKDSGFTSYHYELVTATFKKYPAHSSSFDLWKQGMAEKVFYPQLHGREHLNISRWMYDLQHDAEETRMCFDLGIFGLSGHISKMKRGSYLAAFDEGKNEYEVDPDEIVSDAARHFKNLFGYQSESFIAPNYVWNDNVEKALNKNCIKYIQGSRVQQVTSTSGIKEKKFHHLGQKNLAGQFYLVRNCMFEPSSDPGVDWVNTCLSEISTSFFWGKPAIISTHRVNFMGFLYPENRDINLGKLKNLLMNILKKWPDVVFMTSDQLGRIIENDRK
jgi:hypothetical protein